MKDSRIEFRASESRKAVWSNLAQMLGLSLSEYIEQALEEKTEAELMKREARESHGVAAHG